MKRLHEKYDMRATTGSRSRQNFPRAPMTGCLLVNQALHPGSCANLLNG